uniref:Pseudouridine synthase I TruA alpha/beta domain-containing protein n=1 Tax=Calcidiscus leptoporus TaxID=127549 RepID=A0A7S0JCR4_9EUKA
MPDIPLAHTAEQLQLLTKEELISLLLHRNQHSPAASAPSSVQDNAIAHVAKKKKKGDARPFDMSKYAQRQVAFRLAYVGTRYSGMAWQADTDETVEGRLLEALQKTRLIIGREECNFSRGGRTDKGVSALGQVVALRVRSKLPAQTFGIAGLGADKLESGVQGATSGSSHAAKFSELEGEMDYVRMLNNVLPPDIRLLSWAPVQPSFSARFAASHRTYKYFFAKNNLDLEAMRLGCELLVGEHDFRNFCKIDPNVSHFKRRIFSFDVHPVAGFPGSDAEGEHRVCEFVVRGSAFLYHQVRCMVAVLFLIGERKERPEIVSRLLDVATLPARPLYDLAPEGPLLLYEIGYPELEWEHSPMTLQALSRLWAKDMEDALLRAAAAHAMRTSLLDCVVRNALPDDPQLQRFSAASRDTGQAGGAATHCGDSDATMQAAEEARFTTWANLPALVATELGEGSSSKPMQKGYVPLLRRPTADSVEERSSHLEMKRKRQEQVRAGMETHTPHSF